MNNPYDAHSWSKLYREERSAEASRWHLAEHLRASRGPRGLRGLGSAWRGVLASLGATSDTRDRSHTQLAK
jgi:hypothetical protein